MTDVLDITGRLSERADAANARYFHLRDVEWKESGNGKEYTFEGFAIKYGAWSLPLWTPKGEFIERVLPGALTDVLNSKPDVRMLKNHDKNLVLARTKSGTLEFEDSAEMLRVWARIAKTSYATDLKLAMDRKDIDQMSFQFEFMYEEGAQDRWYEDKATGIIKRDVIKVSGLRDVSIVTFPAYTETAAAMRSIQAAEEHGYIQEIPEEVPVVSSRSRVQREVERFNQAEELLAGGVSRSEQRKLYSRCRQVVSETPWLMLPGYAKVITAIIDERMSGYRPTQEEIQERIGVQRDNEPSAVGHVAVIPVVGPIFNRAGAMQQVSGAKSLLDFQNEFRAALADPEVSGIVLDIDSPGGTVDLVPETAAEIRAASKVKPVYGVANAMAASAAYWLLAACEFSAVTPSGDVGSVGVYMMHQDASEMMKQKGIDTTIVKAGKHKAEGNPFEPLSEEAIAHMQVGVDKIYDMFVGAVADYRGQKKADVIANFGEGRTVMADDALKFGMVDAIMTIDQVVGKMQNRVVESRDLPEGFDNPEEASEDIPSIETPSLESREHVLHALGLGVAQDDPVGAPHVAPITVGGDQTIAELKAASAAASRESREGYLHLLGRIVK